MPNSCPISFSSAALLIALSSIADTRQAGLFFEDLDAQVYTLTADANLARPRYEPLDLFPFFATEGTFQCQARFLRIQHSALLCSFLVVLHPEQPYAFVTDIDAARARNQTPYLILAFAAKGAMIRRSLSFHHAVFLSKVAVRPIRPRANHTPQHLYPSAVDRCARRLHHI